MIVLTVTNWIAIFSGVLGFLTFVIFAIWTLTHMPLKYIYVDWPLRGVNGRMEKARIVYDPKMRVGELLETVEDVYNVPRVSRLQRIDPKGESLSGDIDMTLAELDIKADHLLRARR